MGKKSLKVQAKYVDTAKDKDSEGLLFWYLVDIKIGELMEKGFNDDELADIMNEIESLEKEFQSDDEKVAEPDKTESVDSEPVAEEVVEDPAAEQLEAEEPIAEEVIEEPVAEEPIAEEPIAEEPIAEEVIEEPIAEEPIAEEVIEEPVAEEPIAVAPEEPEEENVFSDSEMSQVLEDLNEMPVEDTVPEHALKNDDDNIHHLKQEPKFVAEKPAMSGGSTQSSMNFHIEGDMKLNLNFNIGGKDVNLTITEEGLQIELDGGAKFVVPVSDNQSGKKVA